MAETSPSGRKRKLRLAALGLGILIAALVFGATLGISEDLRLLYVLGAILLFCSAILIGARSGRDWLSGLLLFAPVGATFGFFVLGQLPFLWPHLSLWALLTAFGLFLLPIRPFRAPISSGVVALLVLSFWYCIAYIPDQMQRFTNHFDDKAAPAFAFQPVSEGKVPTSVTPGRILVIDFFGTWCSPCLAELPELARVSATLHDKRDIEFVIVGTPSGGDTPERLRSFAKLRRVTLPLAFDRGGKARAAFGVNGFPGMVVLDRTGHVRLTRVGYNSSETNFRRDLTQLLRSL